MADENGNTAPAAPGERATAVAGDPAAGGRDAVTPGASADAERIRTLEAEKAKYAEEARQNYDRFVRERADLENLKKRAARDREDLLRYGTESLARALLPVLDNLERAVEYAEGQGDRAALLTGVALVLKSFRDTLEQHGVRAVTALGRPFDPAIHEAMEQVDSAEHDPNTVVREHQKGYKLHDRLLRPAFVGVTKRLSGPPAPVDPADGS
jgi:molecular chaperone GrpE